MSDVTAECNPKFRAVHTSGPRKAKDIRFIVIHCTESRNALSAASWFVNPKSTGSANLVVDGTICYRTVDDLVVPWAAPGKNTDGFHIEIAGYASWSRIKWLRYGDQAIQRAAYKAASRAKQYDIPIVKRTPVGVRLGRAGICGHYDVTRAYPVIGKQNGWHTDPGKDFPWDVFIQYVREFYAGL